ncbi:hypothetical protein GCM10009827_087510 [Dactylosporangium maewongense]|uniref:Uncharacterized protein n=1 Tax=Dactylosporangium maewongense TaxID=634393 RepID=A0ABN2C8P5_9ACTN
MARQALEFGRGATVGALVAGAMQASHHALRALDEAMAEGRGGANAAPAVVAAVSSKRASPP